MAGRFPQEPKVVVIQAVRAGSAAGDPLHGWHEKPHAQSLAVFEQHDQWQAACCAAGRPWRNQQDIALAGCKAPWMSPLVHQVHITVRSGDSNE